jgi:hypothetical protein
MHGQIIYGLYTTLIDLSPTTYKEGMKQKYCEGGALPIITTLP